MTLLLGLDVGTTSTKAALIDLDGNEFAHGRAPMGWTTVPTGAEITAEALLDCAERAAAEALAGPWRPVARRRRLEHGRDRRPARPATAAPPAPRRSPGTTAGAREAERIAGDLGERLRRDHGPAAHRAVQPGEAALAQRPPARPPARGVRWLNVAEWIVKGLGGEEIAELSLASRTGLLDLESKTVGARPSPGPARPSDFLPQPAVAGTPAGEVTAPELPGAGAPCSPSAATTT